MEILIKQLADSAKAFFDNYTAQSLKIPQINENLLNLRGELDRATQAIKEATAQSKVTSGQIRDNVALLGTSIRESTDKLGASINEATAKLESVIDKATEQAKCELNQIRASHEVTRQPLLS